MTLRHDDPRHLESAAIGQVVAHWAGVAVTVVAAYAALIWMVFVAMPAGTAGEMQDAVMIELEPMTAFEEAPPPAPEPEAEMAEAPPAEPEPAPPEPVIEPEPAPPEVPEPPDPVLQEPVTPPEPVVEEPVTPEPPPEPEPLPEPTTEEIVPDLMQTNAIAEAVINPPVPKLRPPPPRPVEKVRVEKKKKPVPPKKVERPKPKVEKPRRVAETRAPRQPSTAPRSERAASSRSSQAPRVSTADWQSKMNRHISRFKRRLSSQVRAGGVARVTMTIDGSGRVSGVRISSSSGNPDFDAEAIALIQRANPLPAPPEGRGGRQLTLPVKM